MTRRLYYEDSHRKEFQAVVTACEKAENYWRVSLDQTAFFPEGGGQAGDSGFLEDVEIFDTHEKQGIVWHYAKLRWTPAPRYWAGSTGINGSPVCSSTRGAHRIRSGSCPFRL